MKIKAFIFIAIGLLAAAYWYSQWDGTPGPLPDKQSIIHAIDRMSNEIKVKQLAAIEQLDSRHIFVPFISLYGEHGMSFWKWEQKEWKLIRIDNNGMPHIWKLDGKDPAKHVVVYHADPKDEIEKLTFYLLRNRNAYFHSGQYFYVPRVQLELPISIGEKNYGAIPFPEEWLQLMESDRKQSQPLGNAMHSMFSGQQRSTMYVGYQPHYRGGRAPEGRGSYSKSGGADVTFIPIINESELERPRPFP
ncbi:hypothetical protein [Paenibacillus paeoniae]|uniref:Uncharacterized protein n=1 Tax=Paenibacillus paeoniae TaxID=2292705 RepID=A0A371P5N9_9BACL|nr:hypothetical protein [Paenibacillus paeoniae]REK71274.1 hypothetical protein DX130_22805 [Paenibacillus paeoniae]